MYVCMCMYIQWHYFQNVVKPTACELCWRVDVKWIAFFLISFHFEDDNFVNILIFKTFFDGINDWEKPDYTKWRSQTNSNDRVAAVIRRCSRILWGLISSQAAKTIYVVLQRHLRRGCNPTAYRCSPSDVRIHSAGLCRWRSRPVGCL